MGEKNKTHIDDLYDAQGFLKKTIKLHPDFLRPVYQYTSAEIRNHQRENTFVEKSVKDDSFLFL